MQAHFLEDLCTGTKIYAHVLSRENTYHKILSVACLEWHLPPTHPWHRHDYPKACQLSSREGKYLKVSQWHWKRIAPSQSFLASTQMRDRAQALSRTAPPPFFFFFRHFKAQARVKAAPVFLGSYPRSWRTCPWFLEPVLANCCCVTSSSVPCGMAAWLKQDTWCMWILPWYASHANIIALLLIC